TNRLTAPSTLTVPTNANSSFIRKLSVPSAGASSMDLCLERSSEGNPHLRNSAGGHVDVSHLRTPVEEFDRELLGPGGHVGDPETPFIADHGVVRVLHDENARAHPLVHLAENLHVSGTIEKDAFGLTASVTTEVESLRSRVRKNVVKERILVWELHFGADGYDEQ